MDEYPVTFNSALFTDYPDTVKDTVDYLAANAVLNAPSRPDFYSFGQTRPAFEDQNRIWAELPAFAYVPGTINTPLSFQLPSVTGATSYVFSSLPTGLTCSSSGLITGTPTVSGLFEELLVITTPERVFNNTVLFSVITAPSGGNPAPQSFTPNYSGDLYASRTEATGLSIVGFPNNTVGSGFNSTLTLFNSSIAAKPGSTFAYVLAWSTLNSAPRLLKLLNFGSGVDVYNLPTANANGVFAGSGTTGDVNGTGTGASWGGQTFGPVEDSSGNLYLWDRVYSKIRRVTTSGVVTTWYQQPSPTAGTQFFNGYPAIDSSGNIYGAIGQPNEAHSVVKITPAGVYSVLAGPGGITSNGYADGTGSAARFNSPQGSCLDSAGNLFIADTANNRIRKVTPAGVVTTFAGSGVAGNTDGTGVAAQFNSPIAICCDSLDNLYVLDFGRIRKITSAAVVTTFATGIPIDVGSLTVDSSGNIFHPTLNFIRKITPAAVVTTFAGSGAAGSANGTGTAATFRSPRGIVIDSSDNLYVTDYLNYTIRKITSAAVVTTLAGNPGTPGSTDGTGGAATFGLNTAIGINISNGDLYVTPNTLGTFFRKITSAGVVTSIPTGNLGSGHRDGYLNSALYGGFISGLSVTSTGLIYIPDRNNHVIRVLDIAGNSVTTLAGSPGSTRGFADGTGVNARFDSINSVTVDSSGNVYAADLGNQTIRKITPGGVTTTLAGSPRLSGYVDATGSSARFNNPSGLCVNSSGEIFVVESSNVVVRRVSQAGVVTTIAGNAGLAAPNGQALSAEGIGSACRFGTGSAAPVSNFTGGIFVDSEDNIFTVEGVSPGNARIKKLLKCTQAQLSLPISSSFADWFFNSPSSFQVTTIPSPLLTSYYFNQIFWFFSTTPSLPAVTSYSATGLPSGLSINSSTGLITGAPTSNPGIYDIVISTLQTYGTLTKGMTIFILAAAPTFNLTAPALRKYSQGKWLEISPLDRGDIILVPSSYAIEFPWGQSGVSYDMSYWGEANVTVPTLPTPPAGFKYKYYIGKQIGSEGLPVIS